MITPAEIIAKLSQLETELEQTRSYINEGIKTPPTSTFKGTVFCYFTQSVVTDYEQNASHLIIGDFHVQNASPNPVVSPTVLLKISTDDEFQFLGKYKLPNQSQQVYNFEWERAELKEFDPVTHYYLKPTQINEIPTNEQLSFKNFQVVIPFGASITVDGYVYFEGNQEGIAAMNYINITG